MQAQEYRTGPRPVDASELLVALGALAAAQEARRPALVIRRLTSQASAALAVMADVPREARTA
ncbi:MAG: hypothetical protein V3S18_01685 [Dehalococcoidia bacterium]